MPRTSILTRVNTVRYLHTIVYTNDDGHNTCASREHTLINHISFPSTGTNYRPREHHRHYRGIVVGFGPDKILLHSKRGRAHNIIKVQRGRSILGER